MDKCCGNCRYWFNTYKDSSLVEQSMGSCYWPGKMPISITWRAVDSSEGEDCRLHKPKPVKRGKRDK